MQKIRKIDNSWKSFNTRTIGSSPANRSTFLHTTWLRFQLPPAPPIMIGRCKDNTNKNRKLAASAGHRPDGEETKKDTQRSRGSRVTQKPAYAGFLFFP
ncbi:hypothetical protein UY568_21745, partial [Escherichia coli]|nr:hypothetical protein [Escherichia coli]MDY8662441.1 hypothetical protein [Escherichia coli]